MRHPHSFLKIQLLNTYYQGFVSKLMVLVIKINRIYSIVSAAIAAEKKIQRDTIRKQRDDYIRRASTLKRELKTLKEQREELITGTAPPSPTTHGFIKENDRLQVKIPIRYQLLSCNTSCTFFYIVLLRCRSSFSARKTTYGLLEYLFIYSIIFFFV